MQDENEYLKNIWKAKDTLVLSHNCLGKISHSFTSDRWKPWAHSPCVPCTLMRPELFEQSGQKQQIRGKPWCTLYPDAVQRIENGEVGYPQKEH